MIVAIGIDMIEVERIRRVYQRRPAKFLERCFHPAEVELLRGRADIVPGLAVRFAAKEAVLKALGVGMGWCEDEFDLIGQAFRKRGARADEMLELLATLWQGGWVEHHGEFYDFENIEVLPKPLQEPHPPVWVAATSPPAVTWAAQAGHTILMDPHSSHEDLGAKRRSYQEQLEAAGHTMAGREIPMARLIALGDTEAEARECVLGAEYSVPGA